MNTELSRKNQLALNLTEVLFLTDLIILFLFLPYFQVKNLLSSSQRLEFFFCNFSFDMIFSNFGPLLAD